MSAETENSNVDADIEQAAAPSEENAAANAEFDTENIQVSSPEYQEVSTSTENGQEHADLKRFQEISVTVSADLGRAKVPIQTLMNLGEGSVLELNREIDSPVELVAQGVALACGEVVVINGCFAVRVTKVYEGKKG